MKNIIKYFALAVVILGFSATSFGQSISPPATATATLIVPISISKDIDMNFGTLSSSATAGTAVLDYFDDVTTTDGVSEISGGDPATTAQFTVTGEIGSEYSISHPASILLTGVPSATTLSLAITNNVGPSGTIGVGGTQVIKVKGTLTVPAATVAGVYSNSTELKITVNYE